MADTNITRLPVNREILTRFFSKIHLSTTNFYNGSPCWEWTGYVNTAGYGEIRSNWKLYLAHRFAHMSFISSDIQGLVVDHLCRNRKCANPAHTEAVTNKENILRGIGFSGINSRKTHCPSGHPYEGDNLSVDNRGYRHCRTCQNTRENAKYQALTIEEKRERMAKAQPTAKKWRANRSPEQREKERIKRKAQTVAFYALPLDHPKRIKALEYDRQRSPRMRKKKQNNHI